MQNYNLFIPLHLIAFARMDLLEYGIILWELCYYIQSFEHHTNTWESAV